MWWVDVIALRHYGVERDIRALKLIRIHIISADASISSVTCSHISDSIVCDCFSARSLLNVVQLNASKNWNLFAQNNTQILLENHFSRPLSYDGHRINDTMCVHASHLSQMSNGYNKIKYIKKNLPINNHPMFYDYCPPEWSGIVQLEALARSPSVLYRSIEFETPPSPSSSSSWFSSLFPTQNMLCVVWQQQTAAAASQQLFPKLETTFIVCFFFVQKKRFYASSCRYSIGSGAQCKLIP